MTLNDMLNKDIDFYGYIKIQCWENDDYPTVYYEGYSYWVADEKCFKRNINHMFPYSRGNGLSGLTIELEKEKEIDINE